MALVTNGTGTVKGQAAAMAAEAEDNRVDIFGSSVPTGTAHKINPEEDAWLRVAPPATGRYSLQLYPAESAEKCTAINYKTDRSRRPLLVNGHPVFESYSINIEARIRDEENPDNDNVVVFATVSTRISRGKDISTAAGLLVKLGYKLDSTKEYTDLYIAKSVVTALKKEPVIHNNLVDWKCSYQDEKGKWINKCTTMMDFPVDAEGNYEHQFTITTRDGNRQDLTAKLFVKEWGGKGSEGKKEEVIAVASEESKPTVKEVKAVVKATKAKAAPAPKVVEPEPEEVEEEEVSAEDEELLLEG